MVVSTSAPDKVMVVDPRQSTVMILDSDSKTSLYVLSYYIHMYITINKVYILTYLGIYIWQLATKLPMNITFYFYFVALTIQFSSRSFTDSESSGNISVTLLLEGGTSSSDIAVIVVPSNRSALSTAEGKRNVSYTD